MIGSGAILMKNTVLSPAHASAWWAQAADALDSLAEEISIWSGYSEILLSENPVNGLKWRALQIRAGRLAESIAEARKYIRQNAGDPTKADVLREEMSMILEEWTMVGQITGNFLHNQFSVDLGVAG